MHDPKAMSTVDIEAESKKLRRHFKFTKDDLEENRRGVLSKKQMKRITGYEWGGKILFIIIGVILLVFAVGFTPLAFSAIKNIYSNDSLMKHALWAWILFGTIILIFGLFLLLLGAAGIFLIVSQFIKRKSYKLLNIRGRARLEKGHGNDYRHVYYDLYINNQEFDGSSSIPNVIISGAEYIVYYLEGVEEIVSVELISDVE
jgi:hypothetical protein